LALNSGWRRDRQDTKFRKIQTRIANRIRNWISDETIQVLKLLQSITSESKYLVPGQGPKNRP